MAKDDKMKPHMMYSKAGKGQMVFTKKGRSSTCHTINLSRS